jgi:hypothetical protein
LTLLLRRHAASAELRRIRTLVHLAQSHTYGAVIFYRKRREIPEAVLAG